MARVWIVGAALFAIACGGVTPPPAEPEEAASDPEPAASASADATVEIVGQGVISTDANQTFPAEDPLTGDLWFSVYERGFNDQTILWARRDGDGWAAPEVAPFSGQWGDRAPRFTPDGSAMLITSNRPRPGSDAPGDMNIWRVARTDSGWGEPELLDSAVNSAAPDIHPSVTDSAIWVASAREGGFGRSDLYRVASDGSVDHLGAPLNDEHSQPDLWVSPDESWMILAITDHPDGHGGDDLYVSQKVDGAWTPPVNLGPEINSAEYEYGPWVTADGEWLLFTSHREGPSHVYRVPVSVVLEVLQGQ